MLFVDLDNVPNFFQQITPDLITALPLETFVICSANCKFKTTKLHKSRTNIHFYLADSSKDAADAVLTSAMVKFDSIFVEKGRKGDVPFVVVSNDAIFLQV